jgi:hypothetical protein
VIPIVTPLEAFQHILRSGYPQNSALADQITSIHWFLELQLTTPIEGTIAAADAVAATDAMNLLYGHVTYSRIRLRGVLDRVPIDIDQSDQAIGDLNIWELTLDCSLPGLAPRIYQNVRCIKSDVEKVATSPPKTSNRGRTEKSFWPHVKTYVFNLLDYHDMPSPDDRELPDQAAVEKKVASLCEKKGWDASESTIRLHVKKYLSAWDLRKRAKADK